MMARFLIDLGQETNDIIIAAEALNAGRMVCVRSTMIDGWDMLSKEKHLAGMVNEIQESTGGSDSIEEAAEAANLEMMESAYEDAKYADCHV